MVVRFLKDKTVSVLNEASGVAIVQSGQTTTVNLLNPDGVVLSDSNATGVIFADSSTTLTAIKSVNDKGSTIIIIDGGETVTIGVTPITLPNGEVFSVGRSGLVIMGTGSTNSISYSVITISSTPMVDISSILITFATISSITAVTTSSKKGESSGIGMSKSLLVISLLVVIWVL